MTACNTINDFRKTKKIRGEISKYGLERKCDVDKIVLVFPCNSPQ